MDRLKFLGWDWWNLNRLMVIIYLGLGVLAVLAPLLSHRKYPLVALDWWALGVTLGFFIFGLVLLSRKAPKECYLDLWRKLKAGTLEGR